VTLEHNYFKLLGIEQRYTLDEVALRAMKKRARDLQKQYHPDRLIGSTQQEQRLAAQFSAQVNAAIQTMKDPVLRAIHLLDVIGIQLDQSQHTIQDAEFLMQQMQMRESLEHAIVSDDRIALENLLASVKQQFEEIQKQFAQHSVIRSSLIDQADSSAKEYLQAIVSKLQFFQKLDAEIDQALASP